DRFGQTIVMEEFGVAVLADEQIAAEARAEAERVHPEVRQVHQVNGIVEQEVIAVRRRIELTPEAEPTLQATFGGEHWDTSLECGVHRRFGCATESKAATDA